LLPTCLTKVALHHALLVIPPIRKHRRFRRAGQIFNNDRGMLLPKIGGVKSHRTLAGRPRTRPKEASAGVSVAANSSNGCRRGPACAIARLHLGETWLAAREDPPSVRPFPSSRAIPAPDSDARCGCPWRLSKSHGAVSQFTRAGDFAARTSCSRRDAPDHQRDQRAHPSAYRRGHVR